MPNSNTPVVNQQKIVDYVNAMTTVTAWAAQITQSQLPPLMNPPAGYADFADQLVGAKGIAVNWTQSILYQSSQIPSGLVAYDPAVQAYASAVKTALSTLAADPNNSSAQAALRTGLQSLQGAFGNSLGAVASLVQSLQGFSSGATTQSGTLAGFAKLAASAEGADHTAVAQMTTVIQGFQKSIDAQRQMLTLEKIANWDLNIFLVVAGTGVGLMFETVPGAIIATIVGIGAATACSFMQIGPGELVDPDMLADLQDTVTAANLEVGALNSQIALVQAIATTFAAIAAQGTAIAKSVQVAIDLWTMLNTSLTAAFDDITAAQSAQASKNWTVVGQQVNAALAEWSTTLGWCNSLKGITYNVAPQVLTAPIPTTKS